MFEDSVAERWVQKLRFIVQTKGYIDGEKYELELIEDGLGSAEPYVAVSYCWASVSASPDIPGDLKLFDSRAVAQPTRETIRRVWARSDVILWSLAFAASQGIQRVWIDQECIDQDDKEDVRAAV